MSENHPFLGRLNDYIDGELDRSERLALERHLEGCAECRAELEGLKALLAEARGLAPVEPPGAVWHSIGEAIASRGQAPHRGSDRPYLYGGLAVAASVLAAVGLYFLARPAEEPPSSEALVAMVGEELRAAESHYTKAIHGLEQIVAANEGVLPPELAVVLGENLDLIERAIDESRAAITTEPASTVAQDSLLEALRRKVTLLQQTILLINEVRKGQGENAMDIIDEMREGAPPSNPI